MKQIYSRYFPTPKFLAMNSCALDISDQSIKYGELLSTSLGLRLGRFGHEKIPPGIVVSGKIIDEDGLARILKSLATREHLHFVRISLPEEQMYLFTLKLPKNTGGDLREIILLSLEEHIPLKAEDTIFDYEIIGENEQDMFIEVLAIAIVTIESYLSVFKKSGLVPISFELEAQAIARAVIPRSDPSAVLIVDFGEARTGASIANRGRVLFTTTLDIGGISLTNMIAKNFGITFEEAEKMKLSYGLSSTANADDIFPAILNGISVLRDELNKQYVYWKTHEEDGTKHEKLDRIILSGGDANLTGLSNYLESSMSLRVENANPWVNISDMKISVPSMSYEESFGYATVLGLALGDFIQKPQSMMNVLPEKEKKSLHREYWMRFTSICLSFFAISGVLAILLMFPSYFFSVTKSNIISSRLEVFNMANPEIATDSIDKNITYINSKLAILTSVKPGQPVSDIILKDFILNHAKGIVLNSISYHEDLATGSRTINISGNAIDRVTLRNFKSSLDSNPDFKSANLPISNFIEKSNINFTIVITMK